MDSIFKRSIFPLQQLISALFILATLTACGSILPDPPRLGTATAESARPPTATPETVFLPAPTAVNTPISTPVNPDGRANPTLTVWVSETSPEHEAVLQAMMDTFRAERGVDVELMLISPALLPQLMETAVLSDTLPDIVLHPMAYTAGWVERGILNAPAADEIIDAIGRETFDPAALELATQNGVTAAIPSDGYRQAIIYRRDWFAENNLTPPDSYETMLAAAEAIFDSENLRSGFVIPTESNLITTHEAFEHIAIANGCRLLDNAGKVTLLSPACREAIDFYYNIVHQYSPSGVQTDTSMKNAYLDGRTGMILASPALLPLIAERGDLAENSGVLTTITGSGAQAVPAGFGNIAYLGVTTKADPELAAIFADYWFNEGYADWLAVESERKTPMRRGTAVDPTAFIANWGDALRDAYGDEVVDELRDGIAETPRWTFEEKQSALLTTLYEELAFPIILQEMLSGYFPPEQTIRQTYDRVVELIPNYAFEIAPTATPDNELTPEP